MKVRLPIATCAVLASLAIVPTVGRACTSPASVHAFTGHAYISFIGAASGPIVGSGGSESIGIDRNGASLELDLNHRVRGKGKFAGTYIFSGEVWAGTISVDDAFSFSEGGGGEETYSGSGRPDELRDLRERAPEPIRGEDQTLPCDHASGKRRSRPDVLPGCSRVRRSM